AYDALDAAVARSADVLLIDTAGRMHTKQPLMKELAKVKHALAKRMAGKPDETWIVLDASLGQNALSQAKVFHEATPITGVVVAKLDGSSKGGFIFSVKRELGVPIRYVGLGEHEDDLVPFDSTSFVDAILGVGQE
ncbi:MAG: signal recognition particle-docking protein FtsY, partial [Verrucomicrobia bacterium]|nr:signal recognition particle-docking protein FtsY [Verrucomicrobiota bacterium]